ncbi:cAMP-binding domain of CRP or a regulatory subunit of cAMP-dependent protein kinases [Chitinophaga jiangningensis]|uniref:cAMP-binding domain of CRP or a regulatory subunit of cAMP-dependent protein kinases n=1 Tax=Chitinophaga jiangningensis TaxID=1419482 RepID=A0A1M7BZX8_9BACT|nr:Crp/Fnr family transcriptional regulator [Chitinophaga jiangningensis]SHL60545.1 cAMP-binding domain of CRP or a regulatory subunit of cAMP-dependent protein kinases [Chitinophaga jiangningensis]
MQLTETISQLFGITPAQTAIFLNGFHKVHLKKNDHFSHSGKICHHIGLVERGLMKCVFDTTGEERVFEFAYENNFIADYHSFITQTPSEKSIICLEDTTVMVIDRAQLQQLAAAHPFVAAMSEKMNELLFLKMHERVKSLLLSNATERYEQLLSSRADLANRIPQYLLASYLNVTPETISRIRRKNLSGSGS